MLKVKDVVLIKNGSHGVVKKIVDNSAVVLWYFSKSHSTVELSKLTKISE